MLRRIKNIALLFIVIFSLFTLFQENKNTKINAQQLSTNLTFEVSTSQVEYVLREPIQFNLRLSNNTVSPVKAGTRLSLRDTNFLVIGENGDTTRWEINKYISDGSPSGIIEIPPNKNLETENLLNGSLAEKIFSHSGQYRLKLEYVYENYIPERETIRSVSNLLTITISEPQGVNKRAYDYLKDVFESARQKGESLQELRQFFVDNFNTSVYAKYIIVDLAIMYRGTEDAKAERELCKIVNINFFYSKQVKNNLSEIANKLRPVRLISNLPENVPRPAFSKPCVNLPTN